MSRTLSLTLRNAINAQGTGEIPIFLLTFTHDDLDDPIFVSSDPTERLTEIPLTYGTVSRGDTYLFIPMELSLPDEREGSAPRAQLRVSNVTRELVELIRSFTTPPKCKMELVLASDPDEVEVESPLMDVVSATNAAGDVSIELALNSMATEEWPSGSFDPASFPGLFG